VSWITPSGSEPVLLGPVQGPSYWEGSFFDWEGRDGDHQDNSHPRIRGASVICCWILRPDGYGDVADV